MYDCISMSFMGSDDNRWGIDFKKNNLSYCNAGGGGLAEGGVVTGSSVNHAFYLHVAVLCVVLLAAVYLQFAIAV